MESQKLLRTTTGNHIHLTYNQTVDLPTLDVQLPTQDGGNFSDMRITMLLMIKEKLLQFQEVLIMRIETL